MIRRKLMSKIKMSTYQKVANEYSTLGFWHKCSDWCSNFENLTSKKIQRYVLSVISVHKDGEACFLSLDSCFLAVSFSKLVPQLVLGLILSWASE